VQARLEDEAQCLLVIVAVTPEGKKELVGLIDGVRESTELEFQRCGIRGCSAGIDAIVGNVVSRPRPGSGIQGNDEQPHAAGEAHGNWKHGRYCGETVLSLRRSTNRSEPIPRLAFSRFESYQAASASL
jgi:hypothetical protein